MKATKKKIHRFKECVFRSAIAAVLALCASPTSAQVQIGVKAGMSANSFNYEDNSWDLEIHRRPGFSIGPTAKLPFGLGGLGADISIIYEQRSVTRKTLGKLGGGPAFHSTIEHHQIAIPLNLRYDLPLNSNWGIYAYTGPQVGFCIGKDKMTDLGEWIPENYTFNINAGIGVTFMNHIQLSAGYTWSCKKDAEMWIERTLKTNEVSINSWQFSAAYLF